MVSVMLGFVLYIYEILGWSLSRLLRLWVFCLVSDHEIIAPDNRPAKHFKKTYQNTNLCGNNRSHKIVRKQGDINQS